MKHVTRLHVRSPLCFFTLIGNEIPLCQINLSPGLVSFDLDVRFIRYRSQSFILLTIHNTLSIVVGIFVVGIL